MLKVESDSLETIKKIYVYHPDYVYHSERSEGSATRNSLLCSDLAIVDSFFDFVQKRN